MKQLDMPGRVFVPVSTLPIQYTLHIPELALTSAQEDHTGAGEVRPLLEPQTDGQLEEVVSLEVRDLDPGGTDEVPSFPVDAVRVSADATDVHVDPVRRLEAAISALVERKAGDGIRPYNALMKTN